MALFGLVFLVVTLILIGIGVAIGLVLSLIAAVLLSLGVLSSSILIGIRRGRPWAGIRAFLIQCCVLAGIPLGAGCAWLIQSLFQAYGSGWQVFVYGAIGGMVSGVIIALLLDLILRRLQTWASAKLSVV